LTQIKSLWLYRSKVAKYFWQPYLVFGSIVLSSAIGDSHHMALSEGANRPSGRLRSREEDLQLRVETLFESIGWQREIWP